MFKKITLIFLLYIVPAIVCFSLFLFKKLTVLITGSTSKVNITVFIIVLYFIIVSFIIMVGSKDSDDWIDKYFQALAIVFTVLTLYSTNNYNLTVQKKQKEEERWAQARKEGAWISDTSNLQTNGVVFTSYNDSNLPLYNVYFFLVRNDNELNHRLQAAQIRRYEVLSPKTTYGAFNYDKVNEENKFEWKLAYIFKDSDGNCWQRDTSGKLKPLAKRDYNSILNRMKINKQLNYEGTSNPSNL